MKLKLTVIFLLSLFFLFYIKDYFLIQSSVQTSVSFKTEQQVIDILKQNLGQMMDYRNVVADKDKVINLVAVKNTVRVFHFWASWCDPCLNELPDFIEFVKKTKANRASPNIQFFLVSQDYDQEGLNRFIKIFPEILSNNFIQLWDKEGILSQKYNIQKLPTTLVIYSENRVVFYDGAISWKNFSLSP